MATRQYIGARYVPKYFENPDGSNEWIVGVPYEPLTIVKYANINYTSKIPVPANVGVPNENPMYWIASDVNGGVNELQKEVDSLKNKVDQLSKGKEKKYIFLMDSYGNYTDSSGKNAAEIALYNRGITGSYVFWRGSCSMYNDSNNFKILLEENDSEIDKESITDIYSLGGANDMQGDIPDRIESGVKRFCDYCTQNYPNAKVHVAYLSSSFANNNYQYWDVVKDSYAKCVKYGASYVFNSEYTMHRYSLFNPDLVHPNQDGINELTNAIEQMIAQETCNINQKFNISAVTSGQQYPGVVTTGTDNVGYLTNGSFSIAYNNGYLFIYEFTEAKSLAKSDIISDICVVSDWPWISYGRAKSILIPMLAHSSDGVYHYCSAVLYPNLSTADNKIHLNIVYYTAEGKTIENVDQLYISSNWNYMLK